MFSALMCNGFHTFLYSDTDRQLNVTLSKAFPTKTLSSLEDAHLFYL